MYENCSSERTLALFNVDPNNWRKNPYTFLKCRYYIEMSSLIIYFFISSNITANTITLIYILLAPIAGILLSLNNNITIFIGIFIFFNRSILDWVDGFWAKHKNQVSLKGALLDSYGGKIGLLCLNLSIGLFCFNNTGENIFLYLTIFLLFTNSVLVREYSSSLILREVSNNEIEVNITPHKNLNKSNFYNSKKYISFLPKIILDLFYNILDGRARSVDSILLLIIIDIYFKSNLLSFVFVLIVIKSTIIFIGDFYIFYKGDWLKNFQEKK